MLKCVKAMVVFVSLIGVPAVAYAQASIVGTARDASGAVTTRRHRRGVESRAHSRRRVRS